MSMNVSFAGMSVKLKDEKKDDESLIKLAKIFGYTDKELDGDIEDLFYNTKLKEWCLHRDSEGEIGLIYTILNERDAFDIEFNISLEEQNEIMGELINVVPKEYIQMSAKNVKCFAIIYYNGSESPFIF